MSTKDKYADRALFFTGDEKDRRGQLYSKLAMNKTQFGVAVNQSDPNTDRAGDMFLHLMKAMDYTPEKKQPGMHDNDVHNEFVDFIVKTALWHRKLDRPTGLREVSETVESLVNLYMQILGGVSSGDLKANEDAGRFNIRE